MESWAYVARCHNALGDFSAARAAYDRSIAFAARFNRPSFQLLNLMSVRYDLLIALDHGWDEIISVPGEKELFNNPPPEFKWAYAAACATTAHTLALQNRADQALQVLAMVPDALRRGAPFGLVYSMTACDAASVLWLLNCTDHIEVVESSIREKVLGPDFRYPMRDGRLSMARLTALAGRYDEATDWFAKSREILDEQGWRPLRAICDYDEAVMHIRSGAANGTSRAQPLLDAAARQFQTLGMPGWIKRAAQTAAAIRN